MTRYLTIPGWAGSGADHWQSHWERTLPDVSRVEMPNWFEPRRADWVAAIDHAVRASDKPVVLIAHSLGCIAVAHWAATASRLVRGALLVAPADLDRDECPEFLREFAPLPRARLRFRSRVVASDNDRHASLARAAQIAAGWGSTLTVLANAGHINVDSGFGPWPEGRALLRPFEDHDDEIEPPARRSREPGSDESPWICRGVD